MSISPFPLENITSRQKPLRKGFGREPHPRLAYLEREEKRMQDDRPQACPPRDAEGLDVARRSPVQELRAIAAMTASVIASRPNAQGLSAHTFRRNP